MLKFNDGVQIDTNGKLRSLKLHDGWYVVGKGLCIPVESKAEADRIISIRQTHQICKSEKDKAMKRYEQTTSQDAAQAINAWDELQGQLHKPKTISKKQFERTKQTALSIINMIADPQYRKAMSQKINNLHL